MKNLTIGIDVGGTNIKIGLIDKNGRIVSSDRLSTGKFTRDKRRLIHALISSVEGIIQSNHLKLDNILGIGIGLPGLVDFQKGNVIFLPNIPGWHDVPLRKIMQPKLKIPVFLDNDVNVIALGEWKYGAGKGFRDIVMITLGTGVGGGLILDNKLYRGAGFAAGEIGHMPLNEKGGKCNCGGMGCLETYIGRGILMKKAEKIFKKKNIDLAEIYDLAVKGNARAKDFWQETAKHLANGLTGVVNLLNPRLIVLGGGISNSYRFIKTPLLKILKKRTMKVQSAMIKISQAKLGDNAGILGADVLVRSSIR